MDIGTFGSVKKYKSLEYLNEKISLMDYKQKNYISRLIDNFNLKINKTNSITDEYFKNYLLDYLIHNDFKKRINEQVRNKYNENIVSHLLCFINAKIKKIENNIVFSNFLQHIN